MVEAEAWSARYEIGSTPWDLGRPHPELERRLTADPGLSDGRGRSVLVPGAGTGHDAAAFASRGWSVVAVDLASGVEAELRSRLEPFGARVLIGDALSYEPTESFDLVFDHTFFCAIDPSERSDFGRMVDRVLGSTGMLISIVFPIGRPSSQGGPPWGLDVEDLGSALSSGFELAESATPSRVPGRRWPHAWTRWSRTHGSADG